MPHVKGVALTEMGIVTDVRNTAIVTAATTVASNGLRLLPCGLLRLGALWLWFFGTLRRRFLCALRLCLLCPLWLCFLRVLLGLRFLGVLRLLLVLRRLGFSAASALFLFFLCECRKGGSKK
jgi:hypothetical protein